MLPCIDGNLNPQGGGPTGFFTTGFQSGSEINWEPVFSITTRPIKVTLPVFGAETAHQVQVPALGRSPAITRSEINQAAIVIGCGLDGSPALSLSVIVNV